MLNTYFKRLVVLISLLLFTIGLRAQEASLPESLSFMAGHWTTSHEWGEMEEIWSAPQGNNMMGTYRCVQNGKVVFYEFFVIEHLEGEAKPSLKLRHFSPGSIAWEDKKSPMLLNLASHEGTIAIFESVDGKTKIIYELTSPNTLSVVLRKKEDSDWKDEVFAYNRKKE